VRSSCKPARRMRPRACIGRIWEDLRQNPANGWALFGLSAALKSQGKTAQAATVARQFATAWKYADVKLVSSAF